MEVLDYSAQYKNISIIVKAQADNTKEMFLFVVPPPMETTNIHADEVGLKRVLPLIHKQDPEWAVEGDGDDFGLYRRMKIADLPTLQYLEQIHVWTNWFFENCDIYRIDEVPF